MPHKVRRGAPTGDRGCDVPQESRHTEDARQGEKPVLGPHILKALQNLIGVIEQRLLTAAEVLHVEHLEGEVPHEDHPKGRYRMWTNLRVRGIM